MSFSLPGHKFEGMTLVYPARRWNNRGSGAGLDSSSSRSDLTAPKPVAQNPSHLHPLARDRVRPPTRAHANLRPRKCVCEPAK